MKRFDAFELWGETAERDLGHANKIVRLYAARLSCVLGQLRAQKDLNAQLTEGTIELEEELRLANETWSEAWLTAANSWMKADAELAEARQETEAALDKALDFEGRWRTALRTHQAVTQGLLEQQGFNARQQTEIERLRSIRDALVERANRRWWHTLRDRVHATATWAWLRFPYVVIVGSFVAVALAIAVALLIAVL